MTFVSEGAFARDGLDWRVRWAFACNILLACASFAIVMPSIAPFLFSMGGTSSFLAWVISSYSIGEAVGAVAFGYAFARVPARSLLLFCIALACAGSALYAAAGALPPVVNVTSLLVARCVQGIGSGGQQAIEQAYVGEAVPSAYRTQVTGMLSSWATLGFLVGPVVGVPLSLLDLRVAGWHIDGNTSPAVFICLCFLVMLGATWALFDPERRGRDAPPDSATAPLSIDVTVPEEEEEEGADETWKTPERAPDDVNQHAVLACLLVFFVHFAGFAVIETICTPLIAAEFQWTTTMSFYLFTVSGAASLLSLVMLGQLTLRYNDITLLLFSLLVALLGYGVMAPDLHRWRGPERYVVGFTMVSMAFPLGRALSLSLVSKLVGRSLDQARYLGVAFAVGAIARIVGPFVAVHAHPPVLFALAALMFAAATVVLVAAWRTLHAEDDFERILPLQAETVVKLARRVSFGRQGSVTVVVPM